MSRALVEEQMNQLKTTALLGLLSALLVALSYWLIGTTLGAIFGFVLAGITNFIIWYYSDRIVLNAFKAKPLTPKQAEWLIPLVRRLCDRACLPVPKIYLLPTSAPNAFATGRSPKHAIVGITEGLVALLSREEVEGVIAHELSHIKNYDTLTQTVAATVARAVYSFAQLAGDFSRTNSHRRGNRLSLLLASIFAPIAASVIQMAISRTREFAADEGAAEITNNPMALASALERLERGIQDQAFGGNPSFEPLLIINSLEGNFTNNLFSTHPPTSARIEQLRQLENKHPSEQVQTRRQGQLTPRHYSHKLAKQLLLFLSGVAPVVIVWSGFTFVSLADAAHQVDIAWTKVDTQLQRQANLIPQLVEVAKVYAEEEEDLILLLVKSRRAYLQASTLAEKAAATTQMDQAIAYLQTYIAEHPQLQSRQRFINLKYEIVGIENRITTERRRYNQAVESYNQKISFFPSSLIANWRDLKPKEFFLSEDV